MVRVTIGSPVFLIPAAITALSVYGAAAQSAHGMAGAPQSSAGWAPAQRSDAGPGGAPLAFRPLRIQTRNLGHFLNTDLNAGEADKVGDLIGVLQRDAHTDVFLFQEISPDMRPSLLRAVGDRYELTMAAQCTDVAVLVRRGLGARTSWTDHAAFQVEQEGFGLVGCSRYGVISARYDGPFGRHTFVSVHLPSDALPGPSVTDADVYAMRCRLLRQIERLVAGERLAGRVVVVGGDFNIDPAQDKPDSRALRDFIARAHAADANRQPTVLGLWRFDHICVFAPGAGLSVVRPPLRAAPACDSFAQGIRWTDHRGVPLVFQTAPALASAANERDEATRR